MVPASRSAIANIPRPQSASHYGSPHVARDGRSDHGSLPAEDVTRPCICSALRIVSLGGRGSDAGSWRQRSSQGRLFLAHGPLPLSAFQGHRVLASFFAKCAASWVGSDGLSVADAYRERDGVSGPACGRSASDPLGCSVIRRMAHDGAPARGRDDHEGRRPR